MTEQEAKQAAINDGISEEQITPQILAFYGYVVKLPTEGIAVGPIIVPDNVKADILALQKEAENNALPAQIVGQLKTILGFVKQLGVFLVLIVCMVGCGESTQAIRNADQAAISVKALNNQHLEFEDRFIVKYRTEETERIQILYNNALASSTVSVQQQVTKVNRVPVKAADGSDAYKDVTETVMQTVPVVPVNISNALQVQRVRLLQTMEQNIITMRAQQAAICANAANAVAYLEALKAYFEQRQVTYESLMEAEKNLFSFLETFISKEKEVDK